MKAYVCDICGYVIADPYDARMREFHIVCDNDGCPYPTKEKVKIHLCGDCVEEFKYIVRMKRGANK